MTVSEDQCEVAQLPKFREVSLSRRRRSFRNEKGCDGDDDSLDGEKIGSTCTSVQAR